jgi:hypothetical protein
LLVSLYIKFHIIIKISSEKYVSLTLTGVLSLAPILTDREQDLQIKGTTINFVFIIPERGLLCKETELHYGELTFQDIFNVSGASYAVTGTDVSLTFGGDLMKTKK